VRGFSVEFSLEDASPARLKLYDLAGRRLFTREVGALGAGDHMLRFDEASAAPAGLYFLRLRQHARALTSRVLVTR
jgi:hypothetical protein